MREQYHMVALQPSQISLVAKAGTERRPQAVTKQCVSQRSISFSHRGLGFRRGFGLRLGGQRRLRGRLEGEHEGRGCGREDDHQGEG